MKKGILQRCSRNWEEVKMAPPPEVKIEPIADYPESDATNLFTSILTESNKQDISPLENSKNLHHNHHHNNDHHQQLQQQQQLQQRSNEICRKHHQQQQNRESMISIRKDYSYKYKNLAPSNSQQRRESLSSSSTTSLLPNVDMNSPPITVQKCRNFPSMPSPSDKLRRDSIFLKRNLTPHHQNPVKSPISILERYDYDKSKASTTYTKSAKIPKIDNKNSTSACNVAVGSAISSSLSSTLPASSSPKKKKKKTRNEKKMKQQSKIRDESAEASEKVKVILAQEKIVKKEPSDAASLKPSQQSLSSQLQPPENINKINNKINIIFQLNDSKNLIFHHHRGAQKNMVQKITIEETNNNTRIQAAADDGDRTSLVSSETQTESQFHMNMTNSCPLVDEPVEYLFFEDEILVSLQQKTISFFEFNRLASLLRKGEPDFKVIDRIPRRIHDHLIDTDNKFQRLCYNEHHNEFPIYVEMRVKQKELDDPEMCPIAFSYCNVYYIDQRRAKFSSVHLDTVKSVIDDILYTCVPKSSYFIMAWNETSPETKTMFTGIVKYKLTPNLDLAKLASIRQFPKLNYRTKQIYCGKSSQLITFGDTQVSIFNYESGDLMMSLDLMKNYGTNLTTVEFKENYLFMVYLADEESSQQLKRLNVIGVNKCEGNTVKVVHSSPVKLKKHDRIISKSITTTNHLLVTFSNGHVLMIHLNNFCDIHMHGSPTNESIYATAAHFLIARKQNIGLRNFAEFFLATES